MNKINILVLYADLEANWAKPFSETLLKNIFEISEIESTNWIIPIGKNMDSQAKSNISESIKSADIFILITSPSFIEMYIDADIDTLFTQRIKNPGLGNQIVFPISYINTTHPEFIASYKSVNFENETFSSPTFKDKFISLIAELTKSIKHAKMLKIAKAVGVKAVKKVDTPEEKFESQNETINEQTAQCMEEDKSIVEEKIAEQPASKPIVENTENPEIEDILLEPIEEEEILEDVADLEETEPDIITQKPIDSEKTDNSVSKIKNEGEKSMHNSIEDDEIKLDKIDDDEIILDDIDEDISLDPIDKVQKELETVEEEEELEPWTGKARDYVDPEVQEHKKVVKTQSNGNGEKRKVNGTSKKVKPKTKQMKKNGNGQARKPKTKRLKKAKPRTDAEIVASDIEFDGNDDILAELGIDIDTIPEEKIETKQNNDKKPKTEVNIDLDFSDDDELSFDDDLTLGDEIKLDTEKDEAEVTPAKEADEETQKEEESDLVDELDANIMEDIADEPVAGDCSLFMNKVPPNKINEAIKLIMEISEISEDEAKALSGRLVIPLLKDVTEVIAERAMEKMKRNGFNGRIRKTK